MDRFWLKNYPPGVPADIDPSVYPSLVSLLEESFAKYRDAKAYVCMDKAHHLRRVDELFQGAGGVAAEPRPAAAARAWRS